ASTGRDDATRYVTIRLWDVNTGKELKKLVGHKNAVAQVAFSPDGKLLASVPREFRAAKDQDGAARLWDVATGKEVARLEGHDNEATCLAFSPDGKRLATGDGRGRVRVWDVAMRKEVVRFDAGATSLAFSPDGRFVAVGGEGGGKLKESGAALQLW